MKQKSYVTDMTEGSPIRLMLFYAIPLFIGNVFQQVYSIVDTMVAGYCIGDYAIAAIGATGSIYGLIINIAMGLNGGFSLVVTRAFGAKDNQKIREALAGTFVLNILITIVLTVPGLLLLRPLIRLMNTPAAIFEDAYNYMFIIVAGLFATILYNMFSGIMRSFGNSRTPLYFLIFACLLNVALDILFVMAFGLGVAGLAYATITAQAVSGILCGIFVFHNYREYLPRRQDYRLKKDMVMELLGTGGAMAFMYSIINIGWAVFQGAINKFGENMIAAYIAAERINGITMQPSMTIATASATFISQNWGAGHKARIRDAVKQTMVMECLYGVLATIIVFLFGRALLMFTTGTNSKEILDNAQLLICIETPFYPVLGILIVLRGTMQSLGQKLVPTISSIIEVLVKVLGAVWMIPAFGYLGACVSTPAAWSCMTLYLVIVYFFTTRKRLTDT